MLRFGPLDQLLKLFLEFVCCGFCGLQFCHSWVVPLKKPMIRHIQPALTNLANLPGEASKVRWDDRQANPNAVISGGATISFLKGTRCRNGHLDAPQPNQIQPFR